MYVIKLKKLDQKIGLKSMEELRGFLMGLQFSKEEIIEMQYYEE